MKPQHKAEIEAALRGITGMVIYPKEWEEGRDEPSVTVKVYAPAVRAMELLKAAGLLYDPNQPLQEPALHKIGFYQRERYPDKSYAVTISEITFADMSVPEQ